MTPAASKTTEKPDTRSLFSLEDKTALITGAGTGMGRAMALGFARAGGRVVVLDRNEKAAEKVAAEISKDGAESIAVRADITSEDDVAQALKKGVDTLGEIEVLVNNAGIAGIGDRKIVTDILTMELEDFDHMLNVNLRGTVITTQAVLPEMVNRKSGSIINMGSSWSARGSVFNQKGGATDYCISKAGVQALTRCAAQDVAAEGIRVNAIAPGLVADTEIYTSEQIKATEPEMGEDATQTALFEPLLDFIPLHRLQYTTDIVGTALYLASDASAYITGQVIHVNGGMLMVD